MERLTERALVSICVPTRDRLAYLRQSLETVLLQRYAPIEVILSDNWSTDGTRAFCEAIAASDERVHYDRPPRPLGLYANHNFAFGLATGRYVCFFHDDDLYRPEIIERYVDFLERHPAVSIVCSDYDRIDGGGTVIERRRSRAPEVMRGLEYVDRTFRTGRSSIALSGAMIRRSALLDPPFDESGTIGFTDIVAWFRIAERSDIGHVPERLWSYRVHEGAYSQRSLSVAGELWFTFSAYCDDFVRRNPQERARVAAWREATRRFRFWALAYDLALHFSSSGASWARPRPAYGNDEYGHKLTPERLGELLADLGSSARRPSERAAVALTKLLLRARAGALLGLTIRYARLARALIGMR